MHFDIVEAIRQKQQKQVRSISIENGKVVVIPEFPPRLGAEEEIEPSEIAPLDD
jgi:hypothetical protein